MNLAKALVLTVFSCILLWSQIVFTRQDGIQNLPGSAWRFWDDMALAIARFVDTRSRSESFEQENGELLDLVDPFRRLVKDKVENGGIEPHQFWRTVNDRKFQTRLVPFSAPKNEDPGRSLLLLQGFRALGGVAPYLLLWLGAIAFAPVLLWLCYELMAKGFGASAVIFAGLVSFSPYWFECLTLPHSGMGFYLSGLVALTAFAVAALMPGRPAPTVRSLVVRAVCLSCVLIVCVWCRSGSIFFVPAAALAAAIGFSRGGLGRGRAVALAIALIVAPVVALRPNQVHNIWLSFWEGMGDFGADHGYSWYDADAGKLLAQHGIPGRTELRYVTAGEEAIFEQAFLSDVRTSPLWYLGVLAKRVVAIVGLTHLSPYGPRDGQSRKTPLFHFKYTTPVDWFGWRDRIREVPISVLYAPTLLLLAWGAWSRRQLTGEVSVLATIGIASFPVPLLISTASGLETQAFSLVYFLGAAFLGQRVTDTLMSRFQRA